MSGLKYTMRSSVVLTMLGLCLPSGLVGAEAGPLKIRSVASEPPGFSRVFSKHVDVFGVDVYATRHVEDVKVLHAAGVLAQYLDNDANGQPDNALVLTALRRSRAALVMFANERRFERLDVHRHIRERDWDRMLTVGLFGDETLPEGSTRRRFDATLEEVLHLVTSGGYSVAYPDVFGERRGTEIARAMDRARGGYFSSVPRRYPPGAWYSYDDRSCDYSCQVTEYFYWGLTSLLGAQSYPGRGAEIAHEWKLNTPAKLKVGDPMLYRLLTDARYRFPQRLPNGKYRPNR